MIGPDKIVVYSSANCGYCRVAVHFLRTVKDVDVEVVDLESIGYMALKRLVIAHGVPKDKASAVPTKVHLKELAEKYGAPLRFA